MITENISTRVITENIFTRVITENVAIPAFAMLRPRGGDFVYTKLEQEVNANHSEGKFCEQNSSSIFTFLSVCLSVRIRFARYQIRNIHKFARIAQITRSTRVIRFTLITRIIRFTRYTRITRLTRLTFLNVYQLNCSQPNTDFNAEFTEI